LQLFDGNEVVVGQKTAFHPRLVLHILYKCAAKAGKSNFSTRKLTGLRVRKTDKEMETSCIAAIDTQTA